ncbi:MAG: radical SAM protein [Thermoflexales bacterium]|nr:radical SAM protein [Thermoflexales bacterium]
MNFPSRISLTLTNRCNLKCGMCGQWSEQGYMRERKASLEQEMDLADWKRIVDELADHSISSVLLRGGEVFLLPYIIELLSYIHDKGMFISIDTNGTQLARYAPDIVRIGKIHLSISVDGPEGIHDAVRGVKGCFKQIQAGAAWLGEIEQARQRPISRSITFTISRYSYKGLGAMPDIARRLGIKTICIVPYYYFPEAVGQQYEKEMKEIFGCEAFSWRGFHQEDSGVEVDEFVEGYRTYLATLGEVYSYPYMVLSEDEYHTWFSDATSPVGPQHCTNVEKLIDIQPNGEANFCVDFPDYAIGNVRQASIEQIWNGERAERFRQYRRAQPLAVCYRCGAKYMSEI